MEKKTEALITIHSFEGSMYEATEPFKTFSYSDLKVAKKVTEELNEMFEKYEDAGRDGYMAIFHDLTIVGEFNQSSQKIMEEYFPEVLEDC